MPAPEYWHAEFPIGIAHCLVNDDDIRLFRVNMQTPLCLTFRHVEPSHALAARVRELAGRLHRLYARIIRCDVLIAAPADHRNGEAFGVSVEITIPGGVINANSAHTARPRHADVIGALDVAFDNVEGQLQDEAPTHDGVPHS